MREKSWTDSNGLENKEQHVFTSPTFGPSATSNEAKSWFDEEKASPLRFMYIFIVIITL